MCLSYEQVAEMYRRQGREVPQELHGEKEMKRHKYNARKKEVDGIVFDSTSEAEAYRVLKLREKAGAIVDLVLQPAFVLQPKQDGMRAIKYVADFQFKEKMGCRFPTLEDRVVDVKGIQTAAFRIKAKLFRAKFPDIELQIWDRNKVRELSRM